MCYYGYNVMQKYTKKTEIVSVWNGFVSSKLGCEQIGCSTQHDEVENQII